MELVANNGVIQKTISLHAWKLMMISKRDCFTNDGKEVGYEFTEDMPVVFEEFIVVYQN